MFLRRNRGLTEPSGAISTVPPTTSQARQWEARSARISVAVTVCPSLGEGCAGEQECGGEQDSPPGGNRVG